MENLFNSLCSVLQYAANRKKFLDGEGLHLMNLMLKGIFYIRLFIMGLSLIMELLQSKMLENIEHKKERKMSRNSALKVIDHALCGKEGVENCEKFVEILGLRTIFPLFMKTPKRNKKSGHTENVSSIVL